MPSRKVRPEQLGWNLVDNLVMTASGNYFSFDETGSMFISFRGINDNMFSVQRQGVVLFQIKDDGTMTLGGNPSASGDFYVGSDITVSGSGVFSGSLSVSGSIYASGISVLETASINDLFVNNNAYIGNKLFVTNSAYIGQNLFVTESVYIKQDLYVDGIIFGNISASISGTATNALTASHLEEQGVARFSPLGSTPGYISGGIWYSSSGEWFLS